VREKTIGKNVYFRGIIEFSNICEKDCHYCGIRKSNTKVNRYRMNMDEIKSCLDFVRRAQYGSVVLQSGELTTQTARDFLFNIVRLINKEYPELGITLSCGELDYELLRELRAAGAHRYLIRIETSVPKLYKKLHPADHSLERRVQCLKDLRELGFQVGCGNMIGLPGQTISDIFADLKFFMEMDFDMFGLGPYVIHKDTPLGNPANQKRWNENKEKIFNMALNFIAILRILMPTCNIAAATALDVFEKQGRVMALKAGANVIMPSVTPNKYRNDYLLYQNKPCVDGHAHICSGCVVKKVEIAGLKPVMSERGNSLHYEKRTI
jgi:biotin synthase